MDEHDDFEGAVEAAMMRSHAPPTSVAAKVGLGAPPRRRERRGHTSTAAVVIVLFGAAIVIAGACGSDDAEKDVNAGAAGVDPAASIGSVAPSSALPAVGGTGPGTAPSSPGSTVEQVRVYAVSQDIPRGMSGDEAIAHGLVQPADVPAQFRPDTAIVGLDEVRGKVALFPLSPGTILVADMFIDPSSVTTTASSTTGMPDVVPTPAGLTRAPFGFRDSKPGPDATSFVANVRYTECAGGLSPDERLTDPVVQESDDVIVVTFFADPPPGTSRTCQLPIIGTKRIIMLARPLGNRTVYDGATAPPHEVTEVVTAGLR